MLRELNASHDVGLTGVKLLPRAPVALFDSGPCLLYPGQAQFHPLKFIDGLASAIQRMGGQVLTHSEVVEIKGGKKAYVKTSQGFKVDCDSIVVATNVPINNKVAIHTKNAAYRSYLIGLPVPAVRAKDTVQDVLLWDTADPYHYIRFVKDPVTNEDILLVGGEDHRTGQDAAPEVHFENLRKWVETYFAIHSPVTTRWSGQIMEPVDGMASYSGTIRRTKKTYTS
ncbi:MAG: FAD-binding oxidoreductase [Bdellovibrionaceae bacterium]|nr:FAD-binding oxidoreductase [Pseudobdellovibrionaceae bacterium]